ncbi:DivIVA domain-containing protein [Kribbella sp. VKM Ac-2569]|uniref:DivIVA domain-containing protein n=1 Tax=Kribbella sp. VKM Ac-2569 TaxID=2512220 RepID=UPI0010F1BC92|nr:DivIVA domain-containing protein [Kribbella sp. VKM Ac-2569]RZT19878.1 DivIVA domain-containing protein [Kribbella sp. VKM Ac-2569]
MWFFGLIVVLLIGAVAVVASGRWGAMSTAYDDRPDMTVPARQALTSTDIESARFAVGVRGYRMDEVDTLLERVAKEVAERDRRIADLERAVAPIVEAPDGHGFSSRPYDPAEFEDTGTQPPILVGGPDPVARTTPADATSTEESTDSTQSAEPAGSAASSAGVEEEDDEPETTELPRASQVAADEYERLQAEARAVLEAQSQPVISRRKPAPHQPAPAQQPQQDQQQEQQEQPDAAPAEPPVEPPATHWTQQPPQEAQEQTQPQTQEQAQPQRQEQAQEQAQQQTPEPPQAEANGDAGDGDGNEGWRFWPPADQQGEGAYQRPS